MSDDVLSMLKRLALALFPDATRVPATAFISPLSLADHSSPRIQRSFRRIDGVEVSDRPSLRVSCADLDGEVTLTVTDPTPWVREDPESLMTQELGPWTVRSGTCEESALETAAEALGCRMAPRGTRESLLETTAWAWGRRR